MLSIIKHFYGFLLVSFILVSCNSGTGQNNKTKLSADEFETELSKTPDAQLVDVRTPEEYKGGYINGSRNMDFNDSSFVRKVATLDKTKPVFVYCLGGSRSEAAAAQMRDDGFKKVYELDGGILKWNAANKPLVKDVAAKPQVKKGEKIDEADFNKKIEDNKLVLVDFGATWCNPCRAMSPILDTIAAKEKNRFTLVKVDVDANQDLGQKYQINSIPTFIIFKKGKQVWRGEGYMPEEMMKKHIDEF